MENIKELNLTEIFAALLRRLWLIILAAVVTGAMFYLFTTHMVDKKYQSRITMYVNNAAIGEQGENDRGYVSAYDLATSQRLVATYINILKSNKVLDAVAEEVGGGVTANQIRASMTASALGETEIFEVVISSKNPKMACKVANAIGKVAPGVISQIKHGSEAEVIDEAVEMTAEQYYYPNERRSITYGMIAGAVIAICAIVLQTMLDVRVKSEEDLAAISNAPVLGLIPDLALNGKNIGGRSGYQYSRYGYAGYKQESGEKVKDGGTGE